LSQTKGEYFFKGNINLNNNGIDWVPLFSRGEPSLVANFSLGKDRFSINPLIRYELEGFQPWGFDIWWNYKIKQKGKFIFDIGAVFPGVINQRISVIDKNLPNTILQPWVTAIINPNFSYVFNQSFTLSLSYYEERPLKTVNKAQIESNRVVILAASIRQILITDEIYLSWAPIIYSVQIEDTKAGIFSAQTINIGLLNSPFSISSVMNKPLNFGGLTGKRFDWNIGLNYSFDLKLVKTNKNKSLAYPLH
tara:strand:- start:365 stop:1114 length:750 start_codon:yes stop_codon:yes gene_type:complete